MTIKPKAPRWYRYRNGVIEPCYETPKKGGNGTKNYTLAQARIDRALPSVTTVLSVIDKPQLDDWRVSQAIHSALTLPRPEEAFKDWKCKIWDILQEKGLIGTSGTNDILHEAFHNPPGHTIEEDKWAEMVLADSEAQASRAAEFGTRIHDAIATLRTVSKESIDPEIFPYIKHVRQWMDDNIEEVHAVEKVVGHPSIGVAGRLDLDCTLKGVGRTICDFKSQALKKNEATFWEDWNYQLAAYAECISTLEGFPNIGSLQWRGVPRIMSIVIPSNEPGPVQTKLWTVEEQEDGWKVFQYALEIWIRLRGRNYDPRMP